MSRKTRVLQKRFAVFCEGDTEYNYIDKIRKNQGVELVLKPINMHGELKKRENMHPEIAALLAGLMNGLINREYDQVFLGVLT